MVALVDHMWQSLQVFACLALFAFLTRNNAAAFRVWIWRLAALKLVIPFHLLYVSGAWLGFPVSHSSDPPPAALIRFLTEMTGWFAPAQRLGDDLRWLSLVMLTLGALGAIWCIRRGLRAEAPRVVAEAQRLEKDPDDRPRGVGFLNAALMTTWAVLLLSAPVLSGAVDDRLWRQELLQRHAEAMQDAAVAITPARRGMGSRFRVVVDERGVTIRNATLQEIGSVAYGVSVFLVRGQHFVKEDEEDWLTGSRHDVRVTGPVIDPDDFDTYALREPLTKALATQFGLEIYQNGKCAPPCGRWGSYVLPAEALAAIESAAMNIEPAQPSTPAQPPPIRERFDAYLHAFNSGDRLTLASFHAQHLTAHSQTVMSVDEELMLQKQMGGFEVLEFNDSRPRVASGWVRARDSDALMAFEFQMEAVEPFRISHRRFQWGTPPKHYFPRRLPEAAAIRAIRADLERRARDDKFSGAVLVSRDGKVLLRQAHGLADRERGLSNEIDTRFRIASVTKMFTAVAVLQLVQGGKVRLDDPIGKWVPEVAGKPMAPVTIHQLLTHTSGAGDIFGPEYTQRHLQLRTHSDYIRLFAGQRLRFPPGTRHQYSNLGYLLLGRMIETASGSSYHDLVRTKVFGPAGMTRTGTEPEEAQIERARIYERPLGMHRYVPAAYVLDYRATSAGHAYSTVDDLARFLRALRANNLLDDEHTQLMLAPHQKIWEGYDYGYGMMFNSYEWTGNWAGHSGGYPGMDAQLWFSPETGYLVAVLCNIDPPAAAQVSDFITARLPLE
jgi:D-alanyl-D-alanine carboxypeptidase